MVARFDGRNPRAETWVRDNSSRLITEIVDEQRSAIRTVLTAHMQTGTGPRTAALDIVGRLNRVTGRREGGLIGLTSGDIKAKERALEELRMDPKSRAGRDMMSNYLNRKTRDRRFDGTVHKAMRDGKRIPAEKARKMLLGMESKMLKRRGETIARTELIGSLHHAQDEAMIQMIEMGNLQASQVTYTWDATEDSATRDSHRAMDGQERPHGQPFITGNGHRMMHPGDRSLGAPGSEVINCRCRKIVRIDFLAELAR